MNNNIPERVAADMNETNTMEGWHWLSDNRKLRYNDGREVIDGVPLSSAEPPVLCKSGMHASATIRAALSFADMVQWSSDGHARLCRVRLEGEIAHDGSMKSVARTRTVLESKRVHISVLVEYAQWCAADAARYADAAAARYADADADAAAARYAARSAAAAAGYAADAAAAAARYAAAAAAAADAAARKAQEDWWQKKWSEM